MVYLEVEIGAKVRGQCFLRDYPCLGTDKATLPIIAYLEIKHIPRWSRRIDLLTYVSFIRVNYPSLLIISEQCEPIKDMINAYSFGKIVLRNILAPNYVKRGRPLVWKSTNLIVDPQIIDPQFGHPQIVSISRHNSGTSTIQEYPRFGYIHNSGTSTIRVHPRFGYLHPQFGYTSTIWVISYRRTF